MFTCEQIVANPKTILEIATAIARRDDLTALPAETNSVCRTNVRRLADVPADRVRAEMEECLLGRDVDEALQWLLEVGAIDLLLPELSATVDLAQEAGRRHKDVWEHTKQVVKQAVKRPAVRWAALLHDIGKVPTRTFTKDGVHFHGHAEVGARMFDKIARRLPFERDQRKAIRFLIKYHLRSAQYSPDWTDTAVRRFAREMEAHLVDLLDLSRADITSKRPGRRQALLKQISALGDRIDEIRARDAVLPPLPSGVGNAIMAHYQLPPSRLVGDIKRELERAVADGELEARQDTPYYIEWLENTGLLARLQAEAAGRRTAPKPARPAKAATADKAETVRVRRASDKGT